VSSAFFLGRLLYFMLLIHRSDPKIHLYGGELTEIAKISWELIEVLLSLWKVRDRVIVLRKPSLNSFEADLHQIIKSGQVLSSEHVQYFVYQILRGIRLSNSFVLDHFQADSQLSGMKYIHSGQKTSPHLSRIRSLRRSWCFNSFSRSQRSQARKPVG